MNHPLFAKRIEWYIPNAVGDKVVAQDFNGNIMFEATCEVASQSQILWTGPIKMTLPNKVGSTSSWQVVNNYASASSTVLILWY
jgi:hypothetical protein